MQEKILRKKQSGITLIALIVTIIVLLILAGISISMITGENGILSQASEAKLENEKAQALEEIELAVTASRLVEGKYGKIDEDALEVELSKIGISVENGNLSKNGDSSKLPWEVTKNGVKYTIDKDGKVSVKVNSNKPEGGDPPVDSEEGYIIDSIEDLVRFAQEVNGGETFAGKTVTLDKSLDFTDDSSYDGTTVTINNIEYELNRTNNLKIYLCEGTGWTPIGNYKSDEGTLNEKYFSGTFDGKDYQINNMYINETTKWGSRIIWSDKWNG